MEYKFKIILIFASIKKENACKLQLCCEAQDKLILIECKQNKYKKSNES